jgi:DNA-binding GntR family transcriptional regulator
MNVELPLPKLERTSTADRLVDLLRHKILTAELPPGSALLEIPLAKSLGVSRNTLREAIQMLASEGLVRRSMHFGATVTDLTDDDVTEIFRVRRLLELQAVRMVKRLGQPHAAALNASIAELEAAIEKQEWHEIVGCDMEFHRRLVGLLMVPRLEHFYGIVLSELRVGLALLDRTDNKTVRQITAQHRTIVNLLIAGKQDKSAKMLEDHLAEAEFKLKAAIRNRDTTTRKGARRA